MIHIICFFTQILFALECFVSCLLAHSYKMQLKQLQTLFDCLEMYLTITDTFPRRVRKKVIKHAAVAPDNTVFFDDERG